MQTAFDCPTHIPASLKFFPFEINFDPNNVLPPSPYPNTTEVIPFEPNFDRDHVLPLISLKSLPALWPCSPLLSQQQLTSHPIWHNLFKTAPLQRSNTDNHSDQTFLPELTDQAQQCSAEWDSYMLCYSH